ncbi:MAG: carbon-nitrogen hydrolase family protein [Armatimonadetes bacterium]|nr:carbon-nitrogen hydrolase family protein [Armatimonadota bacterium]
MSLRVAGAQLAVTADIEANVTGILRALDFAAAEQAEILLTPEGSLSGYSHRFDVEAVRRALDTVTAASREQGVGLALGTCFVEPDDGRCYNQVRLYLPDGAYLGFHSKTLTCGSLTDPPRGEIEHYAVAPLRTFAFAGTTVGALICNDLWANPGCTPVPDPHLTQRLAGMGARVIFHAVNGGRGGGRWSEVAWQYHESNLLMRGAAAGCWIVTVDSCHPPHLRCSAPSGVVGPDGEWALRAEPLGERFFAYTIEVDAPR